MSEHPARTLRLALAAALLACAALARANPVFEWHDLYDGGLFQTDIGVAAATDADGNLVIAGPSTGPSGSVDMLIRKVDRETGGTIWIRRVASLDGNSMAVGGMVRDGAGDLLVGGTREGCFG